MDRAPRPIRLEIVRQDAPDQPARTEIFDVPWHRSANVISCLMAIQRDPVTIEGKRVSPVAWDCNCLEGVCGSCAMNINGKVRLACESLVERLEQPIRLEPMRKFPLVRDLTVDRSRMFEALKQVKGWIPIDGTHNLGPGPRQSPALQAERYVLSTCITCGSCLEACPQVTQDNHFLGAAAIAQAHLFNLHPTGAANAAERIRGLTGEGGLQDCGKAQNCVQVCPRDIPLTSSIMKMNREASRQSIRDLLFDEPSQRKVSRPG